MLNTRFRLVSDSIKRLKCFVLILVLACGGVGSTLNILLPQSVSAADAQPLCDSGAVVGDNFSTSYTVVLNCSDTATFAGFGGVSAKASDLIKISAHSLGVDFHPFIANISSNQLTLYFYYSDGVPNGGITIDVGTLASDLGVQNDAFTIDNANLIDKDLPFADDNYYEIANNNLIVSSEDGVLKNDVDVEGLSGATVLDGPQHGTVTLNNDGSFIYTRNDDYYEDDSFTYVAVDQAMNSSNEATVYIYDSSPSISGEIYKQGPGDQTKVKPGDEVCVNIESSEPVTLDRMVIGGVRVADYQEIDDLHYTFCRTMTATDEEGVVAFSSLAYDRSGKDGEYSAEGGLNFDRTPPVISLNGPAETRIGLGDVYREDGATVSHVFDSVVYNDVKLNITGSVNSEKAGDYVLYYNAVDSFGNAADTVTRLVHVGGCEVEEFADYAQDLNAAGVENNLDSVTADNANAFSGLYLDIATNDNQIGRITFDGSIDLTNSETADFLIHINKYIIANNVGEIGVDFSSLSSDFPLRGHGATLKFYNLNKLGYDNNSKATDVFRSLKIFTDDGKLLTNDEVVNGSGSFIGCEANRNADCYSYTLSIKHFTRFVITKNTVIYDDVPTLSGGVSNNFVSITSNKQITLVTNVNTNNEVDYAPATTSDGSSSSNTSGPKVADKKLETENKKVKVECGGIYCLLNGPWQIWLAAFVIGVGVIGCLAYRCWFKANQD